MKRLVVILAVLMVVAMLLFPAAASAMTFGEFLQVGGWTHPPGNLAAEIADIKAELAETGYSRNIGPADNYGQWMKLAIEEMADLVAP